MVERRIVISIPAIDLRQRVVTGGLPGVVPDRLVEGVVSLIQAVLELQYQTKVVVGLPIIRVRVQAGERLDGPPEMLLGPLELSPTQTQQPKCIVAGEVARLAPQRFLPVILRVARRVPVLLQV